MKIEKLGHSSLPERSRKLGSGCEASSPAAVVLGQDNNDASKTCVGGSTARSLSRLNRVSVTASELEVIAEKVILPMEDQPRNRIIAEIRCHCRYNSTRAEAIFVRVAALTLFMAKNQDLLADDEAWNVTGALFDAAAELPLIVVGDDFTFERAALLARIQNHSGTLAAAQVE